MTFNEWIASELKERNWNLADFERAGGPTSEMVSYMNSGKRQAGMITLKQIAKGFGINLMMVVGHLEPDELEEPLEFMELKHWYINMTEDERERFRAQGRFVVEQQKRKQEETRQQLDRTTSRVERFMEPDESN
jgi:hypothetical protein